MKADAGRLKGKERDKKQSKELQQVRRLLSEQHGDKYEVRISGGLRGGREGVCVRRGGEGE